VGTQHRPDLRREHGVVAEDVAAALGKGGGLVGRLDVLDHPRVHPRGLALARVVDHPLERALAGAHALDGRHLGLQGQDRLDPQGRPEPRAGGADPATALQELQGVDREPHLQRLARLSSGGLDLVERRPLGGLVRGRKGHQPETARTRGGVHHAHALAALAVALELLHGLPRRLHRSRDAAGDVDRHHVVAPREQRLVHLDEVAHRRL
jgi:hypothetical protein